MSNKESIQQVRKIVETMIEGCLNVEAEKSLAQDAKKLARFVHKDCELILAALQRIGASND